MKFMASGKFLAAEADVDPVATPTTIKVPHILAPRSIRKVEEAPTKLQLALIGTGTEAVTLTLYALVEDQNRPASLAEYAAAGTRWIQFDTGVIVTNGTLTEVTTGIPIGGTIYARRTADTITAGQTRPLHMAWGY